MAKKILILSGSPKKNGNTETLVQWFLEGTRDKNFKIEVVRTAFLHYKFNGCISCRVCQKNPGYGCVIGDDAQAVLKSMIESDVIVMATPLYFFAPSAQLKIIFDRMFSLYKWDNEAGTMRTPLQGKMLLLIASAYEAVGLKALEAPFRLTAEYTGMCFRSLLISNAGVSGDLKDKLSARRKMAKFTENIGIIR